MRGPSARDSEAGAAHGKGRETGDNPPAWYYPVRRDLAAALIAKGDVAGGPREAEATLRYRPKDPATLALLQRAGVRSAAR